MPIDPTKLNSLLDQQDATATRQATLAAPQVSPDDMGRALSIAQRRGQPPLVVADNLPDFDEREHLDAVEAAGKVPRLGQWLQQPEHAALAKDDLPPLSKLAGFLPMFQATPAASAMLLAPAIRRGLERANIGHAANIGNLSAVASTGQAAGEVLDMPTAALRPLFGAGFDPLGTRGFARESAGVAAEANKEMQATAIGRPTLQDARAHPLDALSQAVAHYVQQAAQSAPSTLAALATRNPALGAAIMGVPSGAQTYAQLREQGVDRLPAATAAVGSGAAEVVGERLGLEALLAPWRKALLAGPATEFGEEFVTQLAQQNLQDQATGTPTPVGQQLSDAFDAGVTGATMGGAVVTARALGTFGRVAKSASDAGTLTQFTQAAGESKLGKRAPAALEALVGDAGTVYVPVEAARTLYQGDLAAFAREVTGDPEALTAAGQFGDLAIPLAKWASLIAQQPNAEEWARHGRTDVDGHSRADLESIDFDAELADTTEAPDPKQTESVDRIRDDVLGMLTATDRYRPEDADLQASLVAKAFGAMGQRTGMDPLELFQQYNLRINGKPETLMQKAVGKVRELFQSRKPPTETPQFRNWFGNSAVVDADGKPLVVYHGTAHEFAVFDGGRGGFYFTDDKKAAQEFANSNDGGSDPRVVSAYLSIKNPLVLDRAWYDANVREEGGDSNWEAVDNAVNDAENAGHDGLILRGFPDFDGMKDGKRVEREYDQYIAFRPEQIKSATANNGNFDPNDASILRQGSESAPRGQLRIGANRSMSVDLLEGADLSTFLHETGHFFLEVMGDLASREDAPQQVKDDYAAILAWAGNTGEPLTTEQHEAFAEGFESYLMEGKAPTPELQSAFSRFRAWLTSIYRAMLQLRVPLTDEVRSVMDRMLATDEEIAAAQAQQKAEPLPLTDESRALLRPGQWEAYVASLEAGAQEARGEVFAELMNAHKRAQEAWYREESARVREQVEAEFEAAPVVRAWRILAGRDTVDGEAVPPELRVRLDRDAIAAMYDAPTGQRMLERLRTLGVYRKTGGVSPDVAASLLGFDSGDALLQGLAEVRNLTARVDAETTARMRERHPDPLTDGSLPERAMEAVHGNKRVQAMETELALLAQLANQPRPSARALSAYAARKIAGVRVRDIRPNAYLVAERKAANAAAKAAGQGDYAEALKAKRDQALQAALYSHARKAQETADKAQRYLKRFTGTKLRAKIGRAGADYLEQIDGLLERFDFRQITGAASDRRARLADWITRQRADGRDLDLPASLLDDAFRKPWRELTVEELAGLRDAVKQIAHLADLKNVLLLGKETRDRQAVDAAMAASVRAGNTEPPDRTGDPDLRDKLRRDVLQARAATGAATDIARELDGFADGGAVWDNTVRIIRDAMNNRVTPALQAAQESLANLYHEHYTMAELRQMQTRRKVAGVEDAWSKGRILSLALNWGNEGNREAILSQARSRLTPEQVGALLSTLDARDWAFVQGVWQQIDAYWPQIAAAERRRKGLVPEKVAASPFTVRTADGKTLQVPGGYYPLKYEADTAKAMREEADSFYDAIRTGRFAKAATKDGHTIERVGSGGRTVRMDLGVVETHLRDVIRDLELGDAVNYVHTVLHGAAFNAAVTDTGNVELVRALETWLRDVASGEIGLRTAAEKALRVVRGNFTAAVLTWKFVSAALQITGIVQTSVVLGKKHTLDGVQRYTRRPRAMGHYVNEASPFMAQRLFTHVEAVRQVMAANAGRLSTARSNMIRWGYWMMGRVQRTVDVATWLGAEARGMELFDGDVAKARAYADDVVSRAQGSGDFVDKNPLQRGTIGDTVRQSEYIRATTALMGYMIAKSNAAYARTKVTNFRSVREGVKWAGDMANLFVVEALIVAIIRGQMPDDDDGDGSTVDDWLALAAKEGAGNLFGGIPGLSQMVSELRGYDAKGIVSSAWESVGRAIEQAKQGELDKAALKSAVNVAGFAFGIPSSQINKTIDAIAAKRDGQDLNAYDYLAGPPKD